MKFEIPFRLPQFASTRACAFHLSFALIGEVRQPKQHVLLVFFFSQQRSAGPFGSLFKLEDHNSLANSDHESGLGRLPSPARCSKRVKVETVGTEVAVSRGGRNEELPGLAAKAPARKGKGNSKETRRTPAQTLSSESVHRQGDLNQSRRLSRSLALHLRAGAKHRHTTPS